MAQTATSPDKAQEFKKREQNLTRLANNEQWLADNHDNTLPANEPREGGDVSLAGEELGRMQSWGTSPESKARHLRASPVFLRIPGAPAPEIQRRRIADPDGAVFLASVDDRRVAFLRIGPSEDDVATIVRDPGTASITNAFTVPGLRGAGIGSALLAEAVAWAREAGYVRVGVDHESANREAGRFWGRHAAPVALSLARRLPPMTVPGVA